MIKDVMVVFFAEGNLIGSRGIWIDGSHNCNCS